jgi:hypothetical protein
MKFMNTSLSRRNIFQLILEKTIKSFCDGFLFRKIIPCYGMEDYLLAPEYLMKEIKKYISFSFQCQ